MKKIIALLTASAFAFFTSITQCMNTIQVQPKPIAGTGIIDTQKQETEQQEIKPQKLDKFILQTQEELKKSLKKYIALSKGTESLSEVRKKFIEKLDKTDGEKPTIKEKFIDQYVRLAENEVIDQDILIMGIDSEYYRENQAEQVWNQIIQKINPPESSCIIL